MTVLKRRADITGALKRWGPEQRLLLLCGPHESGTADLARLAAAALGDPHDSMALVDLDSSALAAEPGRLADEAASLGLFGGRPLVRVQPATDEITPAVDLLLRAAAATNPVLMVGGDLKATGALRRLVDGSPAAIVGLSYAPDARSAGQWLAEHARELGLRIDRDISARLLAASGDDFGVLANELEKFSLFLNASADRPRQLEASHLAQLGADNGEEDINAMVLAIVAGDRPAVERQRQLLGGASSIPVLRALARRLMQLAQARSMVDEGRQPAAAIADLRPPVFWKEKDLLAAAVANWPMERLLTAIAACLAGERAIKTVGGAGEVAGWQTLLFLGDPGRMA